MLLNFILVPNFAKIPHSIGTVGFKYGFRRKFTQQIWEQKTSEIIRRKAKIYVVENEESLEKVSATICSDVETVNAVGFDCEWSQAGGKRKPVSLLQLATYTGNCYLFRINKLKNIPPLLQDLLENREILKVGVAADSDASNFTEDYNVNVRGWLDLRHLAVQDGLKNRKLGLKRLSEHYLQKAINTNVSWMLRASDWESPTLTKRQIEYAADDAIVGIKILLSQLKNLWKPILDEDLEMSLCKAIEEVCKPFLEIEFDQKMNEFCFVCGKDEVFVNKIVIPREYRKYFFPSLKLNMNHFLVLLCNECDERSRNKDNDLRLKLAQECDAPITEDTLKNNEMENIMVKRLRAQIAARILKNKEHDQEEINLLEIILKKYFETDELTENLINQAANLHHEIQRESCCNLHSYKVFKYYEKIGLIHLMTRWRQWFLDSMKPKYIPEYWPIFNDSYWLNLRKEMFQYPLDSTISNLYKVVLVGTDGDMNAPHQQYIQMKDAASGVSQSNKNLSTKQSNNQTLENR